MPNWFKQFFERLFRFFIYERQGLTGTIFIILALGSTSLILLHKRLFENAPTVDVFFELLIHGFITITAVMGVHFIYDSLIRKHEEKEQQKRLKTIFHEEVDIIRAASKCGIGKFYPSREEARYDIVHSINTAEKKLWFLGVSVSGVIQLDSFIKKVAEKKQNDPKFECKILLMNALRSLAIFRSIIESPNREQLYRMLETHIDSGDKIPGTDPYFENTLYTRFENARNTLRGTPSLFNSVRFYGHGPTCWIVRADDTIYFQPYTFGRVENSSSELDPNKDTTIGRFLPVFKFDAPNVTSFRILEDHFEKKWRSSDVDLFHMEARIENKKDRSHRIFKERSDWLGKLADTLWLKKDERGATRKSYQHNPFVKHSDALKLNLELKQIPELNSKNMEAVANLLDISKTGIAVELTQIKPPIKSFFEELEKKAEKTKRGKAVSYIFPSTDSDIKISVANKDLVESCPELNYLFHKLFGKHKKKFIMRNWRWSGVNKSDSNLILGLETSEG
jgi:hypothetical protein